MTTTLAPTTTTLRIPDAKAFAAACSWVAKRLAARPVTPALGGALIQVAGGRLTVSGFDYDVATSASVEVATDIDLRLLVSARLLAALMGTLPAHPVDLTITAESVTATCGRVTFTLPTMPVEDYPQLPAPPAHAGTVDGSLFAAAVEQVAVAADMAGERKNPSLTGVLLRLAGDRMTISGTDGYRAATTEIAWAPDSPDVDAELLVPAAALVDTAKILGTQGVEVDLCVDPAATVIGLAGPTQSMIARLLDGTRAPARNITPVMPVPSPTAAEMNVAELVTALKRTDLVRAPKASITLAFDPAGTVQVSASGNDDSATTGEVIDCAYIGEPVTVRCNPTYLLNGLNALHAPTARLSLNASNKLLLTAVVDDADSAYRYLIQLVRNP